MSGACLHPPLSSSSALPIFFVFLHAAAVLFQFSSASNAGGVICPPHDCGDGVKIRYPLWYNGSTAQSNASGNGTYICGHPDLAVHCNEKRQPVLHMGGDYYQVAAVDYKKGTISLKDMDLLGSSCPRARHNLTLNGLPLVAQDVIYIVFFFNCSEDPSLFFSQPFHPLTCLDRYSYAFEEDSLLAQWNSWLNVCKVLVRSPVKKPDETHLNLTDFTRILQDGFPVELSSAEAAKCRNCEANNQTCGYVRSRNTANFTFNCLCNTEDGTCKGKKKMNIVIGVCAGIGGVLLASFICFLFFRWKIRKVRSKSSDLLFRSPSLESSFKKDPEGGSVQRGTQFFRYEELHEATNGFISSNELGDGGFGTVYKGKLRDGRIVAVKRLYENNFKRVEQFMNEVEILNRLRHNNLVSLYGCTSRHSRELLLVYEFVPNGTVADHLHGHLAHLGVLSWPLRLRIALETATALAYLHAVEPQIIHRDVKTNNILLDANFHVKVADFGLSRLFPMDATHVSTAPQGTPGYVDPEYHQCYHLTDKSDVYSFGVVLLELLSGRRSVDKSRPSREQNLVEWARPWLNDPRRFSRIMDPNLDGQYSSKGAQRAAALAALCLSNSPKNRPTMKAIIDTLEPILDLPDDQPTGTFVYTAAPENSGGDAGKATPRGGEAERNREREPPRENGNQPPLRHQQTPGTRHRTRSPKLASYTDTALYMNSPRQIRARAAA